MQTLFFENAWEKTISPQDRAKIEAIFQEKPTKSGLTIAYVWQAENHHGAKLVTSLIHNATNEAVTLENIVVQHHEQKGMFSLPVVIPAYHSMPWTFIFNTKTTEEHVDYVIM